MPGENEKVQAFAPQGIENAGVDISFTVPANGWSENSPYTYTWTNSNILSNSRVTVSFASDNSSTDVIYLDCEKVTGGIQLTSSVKPSSALYLVAHIINAKMDSYADVHGDMVATDIIAGVSNVDEALENLDTRVNMLNSKSIKEMNITGTANANGDWVSTIPSTTKIISVIGNGASVVPSGIYEGKWVFTFFYHAAATQSEPNVALRTVTRDTQVNFWVYYI